MISFSTELKTFVCDNVWTFAKTYARTWPHEYLVRAQVDERQFLSLVRHIQEHGYKGSFYEQPITYFDEDVMVYWTMGDPIEEETIVNRCLKMNSYEYRRNRGILPVPDAASSF